MKFVLSEGSEYVGGMYFDIRTRSGKGVWLELSSFDEAVNKVIDLYASKAEGTLPSWFDSSLLDNELVIVRGGGYDTDFSDEYYFAETEVATFKNGVVDSTNVSAPIWAHNNYTGEDAFFANPWDLIEVPDDYDE